MFFVCFLRQCNISGYPGTSFVDETALELTEICPVSASKGLELKMKIFLHFHYNITTSNNALPCSLIKQIVI